jgi:hypothetical protein
MQILAFAQQARKMLDFQLRFYNHLQEMETEFEASVESMYQVNRMLHTYEQTLYANFSSPHLSSHQWRAFESSIMQQVDESRQ